MASRYKDLFDKAVSPPRTKMTTKAILVIEARERRGEKLSKKKDDKKQ